MPGDGYVGIVGRRPGADDRDDACGAPLTARLLALLDLVLAGITVP
jgi:hypothetical protein